jgi:hypothetical protein
MGQRGRRSSESLVVNVQGEPQRVAPPVYLTAKERKFFVDLVASCDAKHFVQSDTALLVAYTQAALLSRMTVHRPKDIATWEKATRMLATLATRLRLAPQARSDPKTIARQRPSIGPPPWTEDLLPRNGKHRGDDA